MSQEKLKQGQGKGQTISEYLGSGTIRATQMNSVTAIKHKMVELGIDPKMAEFIVAVSYPKNHPSKRNKNQAAREIFGTECSLTIINRAFNALTNFDGFSGLLCTLLFGKKAAKLQQQEIETANKDQGNKKVAKKRVKVKSREHARRLAIKKLSKIYRKTHRLSERGAIQSKHVKKYDNYIMNNVEKEVETILAET